ncbi:PREDICTED: uncharacterized protein LOC106807695 [Priapulus caudatus]|uniref:Uncharacterized protein LOC106807695 n=1 Tax=Priapulus caudatus TaxID=37621 RepID=A0ABM1E091_PRICU|nr:PREDICTED: uncharacterized protein LOC106807695 [Priapulus caudatus]
MMRVYKYGGFCKDSLILSTAKYLPGSCGWKSLNVCVTNSCNFVSSVQRTFQVQTRNIAKSATVGVAKQIKRTESGNTTVIEAVPIEVKDRSKQLLSVDDPHGACPLCRLGIEISHTDVLVIRQFLSDEGRLLPRRITGLCQKSQWKMQRTLQQAQRAGLLRTLLPRNQKYIPPGKWKKYNSYYDSPQSLNISMDEYSYKAVAEQRQKKKWRQELFQEHYEKIKLKHVNEG